MVKYCQYNMSDISDFQYNKQSADTKLTIICDFIPWS